MASKVYFSMKPQKRKAKSANLITAVEGDTTPEDRQ